MATRPYGKWAYGRGPYSAPYYRDVGAVPVVTFTAVVAIGVVEIASAGSLALAADTVMQRDYAAVGAAGALLFSASQVAGRVSSLSLPAVVSFDAVAGGGVSYAVGLDYHLIFTARSAVKDTFPDLPELDCAANPWAAQPAGDCAAKPWTPIPSAAARPWRVAA